MLNSPSVIRSVNFLAFETRMQPNCINCTAEAAMESVDSGSIALGNPLISNGHGARLPNPKDKREIAEKS
jgi:hypothetical protein